MTTMIKWNSKETQRKLSQDSTFSASSTEFLRRYLTTLLFLAVLFLYFLLYYSIFCINISNLGNQTRKRGPSVPVEALTPNPPPKSPRRDADVPLITPLAEPGARSFHFIIYIKVIFYFEILEPEMMLLDTQAEAFNHRHGERQAPPPPPPPPPSQPRELVPGPYSEPLENLIRILGYIVGHAPVYNPKAPSRMEGLAQAVEFAKSSLDDHAARCLDDLVTMQRCLKTVFVEVTQPREIRSTEFKADSNDQNQQKLVREIFLVLLPQILEELYSSKINVHDLLKNFLLCPEGQALIVETLLLLKEEDENRRPIPQLTNLIQDLSVRHICSFFHIIYFVVI